VGSGAAGLPLAERLARAGLDVLLVESGGLRGGADYTDLNRGTSESGGYPFEASRARAFGGTTTRWTGACISLNPEDFRRRDWLPSSGWPLAFEEIAPYLAEAASVFGMADDAALRARLETSPFHGGALAAQVVQYARPADLGQAYRERIARSDRITSWLHATVTRILVASDRRALGVEVNTPANRRHTVLARATVLACGGLENARLLLASNDVQPAGLGNENDMVGRCHMEHPIRSVAVLPIGRNRQSVRSFTDTTRLGGAGPLAQGTFGLSASERAREGLLDMHLRVFRYHRLEQSSAIIRAKAAWRARRSGWPAPEATPHDPEPVPLRAVADLPRYLAWHLINKTYPDAPFDHVRLTAFLEQEPDPENRITLSHDKDRFGQPLAHLRFRESAFMEESAARSLERLEAALSANGLPGLAFRATETAHLLHYQQFGLHQMGSTRMSEDPRDGVVDRDGRVHGLPNLFVAGSSVFPTGGAANPTLTITALALRQADRLRILLNDCCV